jgi:AraC family transcriptional regulator
MPDLPLMAQALDFIEANLQEPIGVADMAASVGYSLYHFCREFNKATHHTAYDYMMRRRLAEATRALLQPGEKIIDIALDYQFNNPETFSRAFKRVFNTQPSELRRQGYVDSRRVMPRLTLAHLEHIAKGAHLKPVLVEKDAFRVAGIMSRVEQDRSHIPELWALLSRELDRCADRFDTGDYYGIEWYPVGWERRSWLYLAAVEMPDPDVTGTPLVVKKFPARTWIHTIHKGPRCELPLTLDYVYHTWLPKSNRTLSHPLVIERYDQNPESANPDCEITLYLPLES